MYCVCVTVDESTRQCTMCNIMPRTRADIYKVERPIAGALQTYTQEYHPEKVIVKHAKGRPVQPQTA